MVGHKRLPRGPGWEPPMSVTLRSRSLPFLPTFPRPWRGAQGRAGLRVRTFEANLQAFDKHWLPAAALVRGDLVWGHLSNLAELGPFTSKNLFLSLPVQFPLRGIIQHLNAPSLLWSRGNLSQDLTAESSHLPEKCPLLGLSACLPQGPRGWEEPRRPTHVPSSPLLGCRAGPALFLVFQSREPHWLLWICSSDLSPVVRNISLPC